MPKQFNGNMRFHLARYKQFYVSRISHYYTIQSLLRPKEENKCVYAQLSHKISEKLLNVSLIKSSIDYYYVVILPACVSRRFQADRIINCSLSP